MALCLTFGGTPCLFECGIILETICNLATALLLNNNWDPFNLHAPNQANFPTTKFLTDDIHLAEGKELIVNVSVNTRGIHNIYIYDLIGQGLDLLECNNRQRSEAASLLAINCTRPVGQPQAAREVK